MNEEIMRVLKMVEEGKIPASEASKLIDAINSTKKADADWIDLNQPESGSSTPEADNEPMPEPSGKKPSWLFIIVDGGDKKKVRVRVPIKLARWALKFVPKSAQAQMKEEFGSDFDFKDIDHILDELPTDIDLINVFDDEKGEHVRIFLK
jgi:hypothetical protein